MSEEQRATRAENQPEAWERWAWVWTAMLYLAIALPATLALLSANESAGDKVLIVVLSLLALLWFGLGKRLLARPALAARGRVAPTMALMLGLVVIWFALIQLNPYFYITLFGLFGQIYSSLPIPYSLLVVGLAVVLAAFMLAGGSLETISLRDPGIWIWMLSASGSIFLAYWINSIINQSIRRRELIEQLETAQAELAAAERRAGMLAERQRLAHEIHDTLAQGFISIIMQLEAAEQLLPPAADQVRHHVDQARRTARSSLQQARRVVEDLRPESLQEASLPEAIQRTATRWRESSGIAADATVCGDIRPLHPQVEVTLLRATQEALANVHKHAGAAQVNVTLSYFDDTVVLDVQDDGRGLANADDGQTDDSLRGGYGLVAMRERVQALNGRVLVESEPDQGTTLVVEIPLP